MKGPFVRFLSMKQGVALDGETQLSVELDNPVSLEVAISLKITAGNEDSEMWFHENRHLLGKQGRRALSISWCFTRADIKKGGKICDLWELSTMPCIVPSIIAMRTLHSLSLKTSGFLSLAILRFRFPQHSIHSSGFLFFM